MNFMKKLLLLFAANCCLLVSGSEMKNFLPLVTDGDISNPETADNVWYPARNIECVVKFESSGKDQTLRMTSTSSGYANYRCNLKLEPGEYTLDVLVSGNCEQKGVGLEVYNFPNGGNPHPVAMDYLAPGKWSNKRFVVTFKVPENSQWQRLGLVLNSRATVEFCQPMLYRGRHTIESLPPRAGASNSVEMKNVAQKWIAQWLWVKNPNNVSEATFIKKFNLRSNFLYGVVQVTADDAYTLKVNGQVVGSDSDPKTVEKYDITSFLTKGGNVIELTGENSGGPGGVILQGAIWFKDGSVAEFGTDKNWRLELDGSPADNRKVIVGKVPCKPWGNIEFKTILPPNQTRLPLKKYINTVPAGEIFAIEFKNASTIPEKELPELKFSFFDGQDRRIALSPFVKPQIRLQDDILYVELPISLYANPGKYSWKLEGLGCELAPEGESCTLTVLPPEVEIPGNPGTKFPRFNGSNRMYTPAGEQGLFIYSTYTPSPQRYYNWRQTGMHMYEVFLQTGDQLPDGTVDLSNVELTMMQILAGDPDAGIYIKIRVDTPGWWAELHPEENFVSSQGRSSLQSYCSEVWMRDMQSVIKQCVDGIAARPVGKALSGVLIMGFRGGEFQLWGEDVGEYDRSEPAKKAFTEWQQKQGYSDLITLPHPALEFPFKPGNNYAEVRERFFRFTAERQAQNLIEFARFFKDTYGDRYSFGVYFGYPQEHSGSINRMLFSGHLAFDKVLDEAPIDTIGCPASYGLRPQNRSHAFMNQPEAASLRGIMSIIENDFRTFVAPYPADSSGRTICSMRDTFTENSRLALFAAAHGSIVRYLALSNNEDWFAPLPSIEQIRRDNLRSMKLEPAPIGADDQVAWAIDPGSWCKMADAGFSEKKWADFGAYGRDAVMRTGRSVAFVLVDDVIKNPGNWKYVAIPAPGLLAPEKRAALEAIYGKFPQMQSNSGALVIANGRMKVVDTLKDMRDLLATPEALKAGWDVVWYVGGNFVGTWDGNELKVTMK